MLRDGLPYYLVNDLERIQRRSLRIIGLPVDTLPPLSERRDKLTLREMETITQDVNHPCHILSLSHRSMTIPLELEKKVLM